MRRLVATLACRLRGSRLYGKPLQNLDIEHRISILGHQVALLSRVDVIDSVVLGIAEGRANLPLVQFAEEQGLPYVLGNESDVLSRLIACAEATDGTDAFRVTTESPFPHWELIASAWSSHVSDSRDVTVVEGVPLGSSFEIYTVESLRQSHELGDERHRSELCSLYIRENRSDFDVSTIDAGFSLACDKYRLTVDYPEDLVLCREVYAHLRDSAPLIPLSSIIEFLDAHPELVRLVEGLPVGGYWT